MDTAVRKLTRAAMLSALLGGGLAVSAGPAAADGWPLSVAGSWNAVSNQTFGTIQIFQGAVGLCKRLTGTAFGDPIQGAYCPGSGRITFHRFLNNAITKTGSQFYYGQLSQAGAVLRMAGSFSVRSDLDSPGEYSFSATK